MWTHVPVEAMSRAILYLCNGCVLCDSGSSFPFCSAYLFLAFGDFLFFPLYLALNFIFVKNVLPSISVTLWQEEASLHQQCHKKPLSAICIYSACCRIQCFAKIMLLCPSLAVVSTSRQEWILHETLLEASFIYNFVPLAQKGHRKIIQFRNIIISALF